MAATFIAAGTVATGTNPTVTVPSGYAQGDLLLIFTTGSDTPTTPAGWTQQAAQGLQRYLTVLYKFAGASETSVALTMTSTASKAVMLAYRGISAVDVVSSFTTASTTTTIATSTLTTTAANDLVISLYGSNSGSTATWTAPGSTNARVNSSSTTSVNGLLVVDEIQAAAGLSTARTATVSSARTMGAVQLSYKSTTRYWVGGSGTWDNSNTTNWSDTSGGAGGASAPTAYDDVYFDANSGTAATVTVASTAVAYQTTINKSDINLSLSGNATLATTAGAVTLTTGTITLNNNTLSCGIFSSSNSNTRAISFGSGNIALTSTTAATAVLSMATATGFTWTGTGGFTRNMAATATINFGATAGGTVSNAPNLTVNAGLSSLTITSGSYFKNLIFTGSGSIVTATYNACGNLTLATGGTYTSVVPTFLASGTVTSVGKTLGNTTVNGSGITVTLADAMTLGVTSTFTLTQGTIDLANFTLSTGSFSSSNANTRAITFGSGNIALTSTTAATTVLSMATATNFTWTGTGGFTRNMAATATMVFGTTGGTTSNAPNLTVNAGASTLSVTTGSYFKNVNFTGSTCSVSATYNACGNLTCATGGTYSLTAPTFLTSATVTSNGKTLNSATVNGSGITVTLADAMTTLTTAPFTLTQGTFDLAGFTLSTGYFSSSNSNTRSISFGSGNIALTSTTSATVVVSMATATGFTWTGTGEFTRNQAAPATATFGSTAGGTVSNAPNLTVNAGVSALTITGGSYFKNVNFTGSTSTVTGVYNACGNLTLATGGIYTSLDPTFRASGTVTSNGKPLSSMTVNGSGITATLADNLQLGASGTGLLTLTQGTFDAANFDVSIGILDSSNSNTRTLNMGSGTWTIYYTGTPNTVVWNIATSTNMTLNPSTSTINLNIFGSSSSYIFNGGGLTYYNLTLSRADAFSGSTARIVGSNTFNSITNTSQPLTLSLTAGTTQTVSNFGLSGTAGNLVTVDSITAGSQATLSKSSGTINAQYLSIKDSNAIGGATWNALTTNGNVNNGNNTGWSFSLASGNMFLVFM